MHIISAAQYYGPSSVKEDKVKGSLRSGAREPVPLNYGDAGSLPFMFELPDGKERDVGFIRVFVSTQHTDLSVIKQAPVMERGQRNVPTLTVKSSVQGWDAISFPVVLTAP